MCHSLINMFCVCFGLDEDELEKDTTDETCPLIGEHNKSEEIVIDTEPLEDGSIHSLEYSSASLSSLEEAIDSGEDIGSKHSSDNNSDSADSFLLIDLDDDESIL